MSHPKAPSCSLAFLAFVWLLTFPPAGASAATWIVDPGGAGHATTVAGGLALASYGDTVLVRAGTYYEHLLMMPDGVVLLGESGPELTVLNGSYVAPVFWCEAVGPATGIEGFTITNARNDSIGGAIVCLHGASPRIAANHIVGNHAPLGAAIGCAEGSSPLVEGNLIADNICAGGAGGIWAFGSCDLVVRENVFRNNLSVLGGGGAMWFGGDCSPIITDNFLADNVCAEAGGGIWLGWGHEETPVVRRNVFVRNQAGLEGGAIYAGQVGTVLMDHNTFYGNAADGPGPAVMLQPDVCVVFENNIVSWSAGASPAVHASCGEVDCNDFWMNAGGDYKGMSPGAHDLFLDPQFCDAAGDDFTLMDCSPCVEGFGCGLIGALGVGCGGSATIPSTWGGLKDLFR
jgi:predicted outer membrane repeat protein